MSRPSHSTLIRLAVTVALVLGLSVGLAGCGKKSATKPTSPAAKPIGITAKQALPIAQAAVATSAPDAKLLLVAAGAAVTPTAAPVWQYLFGSPKTNTTYVAVVRAGKGTSMKYGTTELSAAEWKAVPSPDRWKIDSDVAVTKALELYKSGSPETPYVLGFVAYIPKTEKVINTPAMLWSISFDPKTKGTEPTSTITVNVETGAAAFAK